MAFRGRKEITAAILNLIGSAGQKIVGWVDNNGQPRFDFYSGSSSELEPGFIATNVIDAGTTHYADLQIKAPDIGVGTTAPFIKLVGFYDSVGPVKQEFVDIYASNDVRILVAGLLFNPTGSIGGEIGNNIHGFDYRRTTLNTFTFGGVAGLIDIPHNLGSTNVRALAMVNANNANRYLTRDDAGDTNTTLRFRALNGGGAAPVDGTSIGVECMMFRIS